MVFDKYLIAPFNTGLETDLRPWIIPDQAFAQMDNAYVFRGRVIKRFGETLTGTGWTDETVAHLYSRLRIALTGGAGIGTLNAGTATGVLATRGGGTIKKVGQIFSVGNIIFTIVDIAAGAHAMLSTDPTASGTYNITTDTYVINAVLADGTQIYFYPSEPVQGITQYDNGAINNQPTWAYDTQFAYTYSGGYWIQSGAGRWHGNNLNFYWSTNWTGVSADKTNLFVSNFQVKNLNGIVDANDDPIWTYDGATWSAFKPVYLLGGAGAGNYIVSTALIILPFKDRLVLLNTVETDNTAAPNTLNKHFPNRCRFSHNGSPFPTATAWLEPNQTGADGAGWVDAPTEEEIVSAGFVKDRLIVYFERSTWELVYTGNQILPFVWQKINTELGSESTYSSVQFDKVLLTIGNTGIHACNGANVERIDNKIPEEVFQIKDKLNNTSRVSGVRDYFVEMVYWTFQSNGAPSTQAYPNKVLVYNYQNGSWSFNDDCITTFGYFEQQADDTWQEEDIQWNAANFTWNSGITQAQFRQVIAGNPQGYVFIVNPDVSTNAPVMMIAQMAYNTVTGQVTLTIVDHNLAVGDFIKISNTTFIPGIYKVTGVLGTSQVTIYTDVDPGIYTGGATITRVSNIVILSKQWNPYVDQDYQFHLSRIDFNVDRTTDGQVTVDYFPSYTQLSMIDEATATGSIMGTSILETSPYTLKPLEKVQDQLWHPVYFQTDGDSVQIKIYMNDDQMTTDAISSSWFELHAMVLYTRKTSTRL